MTFELITGDYIFDPKARRSLVLGLGVLAGVEAEVEAALGAPRVAHLKAELAAVLQVLDGLAS